MNAPEHRQIAALIDAVGRIRGRLKGCYAPAQMPSGLTDTEATVLTAVVGAAVPPTVAQIGRSLGHPRQVIQRATNQLIATGLVLPAANPDHKRAPLLHPTPSGTALAAETSARAEAITARLADRIDTALVVEATAVLNRLRAQIEAVVREDAA
jgi:DNA-binding MarR family transcriptional regulator